jgi:hypothetical protein
MTEELINYAISEMKAHNLVDDGVEDQNIGKMNTDRIRNSYTIYQKLGLIKKNIELESIYLNQFIDKVQLSK